jgi:hypothetical protein
MDITGMQVIGTALLQTANSPIQIHCISQTALETWLKQLPQIVLCLVPAIVAIWIARWSFSANRRKEHKQWLRDQTKAEWKELMVKIATIEQEIPVIFTGLPDHATLESTVMNILPILRGTIFVYPRIVSSGFIDKWMTFVQYVSGKFSSEIRINRNVQTNNIPGIPVRDDARVMWQERSTNAESEVRDKFHALLCELRTLAHNELVLERK